jgi:hypothetical protein
MQLRQHHVHCPATRELCSGAVEDTWHVLFDCEGTKNCWMAAGLQTVIAAQLQEYDNTRDVIFDICNAAIDVMMIWLIWNNRNQ